MNFQPVVRFGVMSDLHYQEGSHFQRRRFQKAMEAYYSYSRSQAYQKLDALYIVGDFADTGRTAQMGMLSEDCKSFVEQETKLVLTLANHELHYIPDMSVALADFDRIFQMPRDRHEVIGGYHFISLSATIDKGPWHDSFDEEKRSFLKDALELARRDTGNKPIFVFQHPGQVGTVAGGVFGNKEIYSILAQYPQVVDFSGHSHFPVNYPQEIHQGDYTSVSTGSLYNITIYKQLPLFQEELFESKALAHALLVEADAEGTVRILLLDVEEGRFFEKEYLLESCWDRSQYRYTVQRAANTPVPYFAPEARGSLESTGQAVTVTFPAAKCDGERVFGYKIVVKSGGIRIAQKNAVSDFPAYRQKDSYCVTLDGISGSCLTADVYALGFWENCSEPLEIR